MTHISPMTHVAQVLSETNVKHMKYMQHRKHLDTVFQYETKIHVIHVALKAQKAQQSLSKKIFHYR